MQAVFDVVKKRCGIAEHITVYDDDLRAYLCDCETDMLASGVPEDLVKSGHESVMTAMTLYVKAYLGDDRSDTEKYLDLYRKRVFRLTLEGD